tara:strand:+ start:3442 stop:3729 length:288 start_codon:yes stop_codon:yes gene_type:complete
MENSIPSNASIPPKVGEYGYFLTKYFENRNNESDRNLIYYPVKIKNHKDLIVPCHYSLKNYINHKPFVVSWGEIVNNVIINNEVEGNNYNDFNYR